jgi:hypothetical protein
MYLMGIDFRETDMNCWFLVQDIQRYVYDIEVNVLLGEKDGVEVPGSKERAHLFTKHPERRRWIRADTPVDGAIVLTARKTTPPDFYQHAGVYIEDGCGGSICHYDANHGVALDPVWMFLEFRKWNVPHYYVRKLRS